MCGDLLDANGKLKWSNNDWYIAYGFTNYDLRFFEENANEERGD